MKEPFIVSVSEAGQRVDRLVAQKFPESSRSQWQKHGQFWIDEQEVLGGKKVKEGQNIECDLIEPSSLSSDQPIWEYDLEVLAESKTWLVINKPVGASVHPSKSENSQKTIVNALLYKFGKDFRAGNDVLRPGIVHRLDKVTSGVLLIAKNTKTYDYLQEHWSEVEKFYYAVVSGCPTTKGKIEGGIMRDPKNKLRMTVSDEEKAKSAETYFEVISSQDDTSLLRVRIPTGRTHQIRTHLSSIGFPILGDELYGGASADRVFLHAEKLTFPDPDKKGERTSVESQLPKGFK
mgnify:CR=1 FL=1